MSESLGISVVVCTYNGACRLAKVVNSLINNTDFLNKKVELILVDNNSTDGSSLVFKREVLNSGVDFKIVTEYEQGLMYARKRGVSEAKYPLITFVDDDNYLVGDWFEFIDKAFTKYDWLGALGGIGELYNSDNFPEWFWHIKNSFAIGPQQGTLIYKNALELRKAHSLYGAGLTIRKEILELAVSSGYKFSLSGRSGKKVTSGEDGEICEIVKLSGYVCTASDELLFYHDISHDRINNVYIEDLFKSFGEAFINLLPLRNMTKYNFVPEFFLSSPQFVKSVLLVKLMFINMFLMVGFKTKLYYESIMVKQAIETISEKKYKYKEDFFKIKYSTRMFNKLIKK